MHTSFRLSAHQKCMLHKQTCRRSRVWGALAHFLLPVRRSESRSQPDVQRCTSKPEAAEGVLLCTLTEALAEPAVPAARLLAAVAEMNLLGSECQNSTVGRTWTKQQTTW